MPSDTPGMTLASFSEIRMRSENQDGLHHERMGDALLLVVCDGMGGAKGGARASALAIETIRETVEQEHASNPPEDFLERALLNANTDVRDDATRNPKLQGMGTTAVAVWVDQDQIWCAWVGDSRLGRLNNVGFEWLTEDHTKVQEQIRAGILHPLDAHTHKDSHILSRAIGVATDLDVGTLGPIPLKDGDTLLLSSDGVHGRVRDHELEELLMAHPKRTVQRVSNLLAERCTDDNATAIVLRNGVRSALPEYLHDSTLGTTRPPESRSQPRASQARVIAIVGVVVLLGLVVGLWLLLR